MRGVLELLRAHRPSCVLDLGCGDGDFLVRLAGEPWLERLIGLEPDGDARARLAARTGAGVKACEVIAGSALDPPPLPRIDAVVMIEVIEHLPAARLSRLEQVLFRRLCPALTVITTPNAEFNPLLGVPAHRMRHPDHRFEWTRAKFRRWAKGAAARAGLGVACGTLGGAHPTLGGASQIAAFTRLPPDAGARAARPCPGAGKC